jgi:hypothetical protein
MRVRVSLWQAAVLLGAAALVASCSSKHSGSSSMVPTVAGNGPAEIPISPNQAPAANDTKCCALPEMQTLGVTSCYEVSDAALGDPSFVASHGICTVAETCYFGCPSAPPPGT